LGKKLVSAGNGICDCYLLDLKGGPLREQGEVKNGLRDSVWLGFIDDEVVLGELYEKGEFKEGLRYDGEKEYKYNSYYSDPDVSGGLPAMQEVFKKNLRYPVECRRRDIQGVVKLQFKIDKRGIMTDWTVLESVHPLLDAEAVRVLKLVPWIPAMERGKPQESVFRMPVTFKLH
jgi:TonB family protein